MDGEGNGDELGITQPEEDGSFEFSQLPLDLQRCVVEKFAFNEFFHFEEVSRLSQNACWADNRIIPYNIATIYVNKKSIKMSKWYPYEFVYEPAIPRIPYHTASRCPIKIEAMTIILPSRVSSGRMQAVARLFERNKTTSEEIAIKEHITFKPEDLDRLIKVTKPHYFKSSQFVPRQFFQTEGLQSIKYLSLNSTGCTDEELVKLNGNECIIMRSDFITARGLNNFMKQWRRKEREIDFIRIKFGTTNGSPNVHEIIAGIGANPVWTPATHNDSVVGGLPIEDIFLVMDGDSHHYYSLWRPDDHENAIMLKICNEMFEVRMFRDEASYVLDWLTDDQYYFLRNECMECGVQFCEHRRRYSTARLKKFFPRVYSFLSYGFLSLGVMTATAQCLTYIAGDRPFTRVPRFGFEMLQQKTGISRVISMLQLYLFDYV